jgi:hypothetical protein
MKAEELMIGDWVNFHLEIFLTDYEGIETVHDEVLEIGKVSALNSIGNVWVIDSEGEEHQITNDEIEPIPLTTEILDKNGFKEHRDYGYFIGQSNSGYYIYFDNNHLSIQAGYDVIEFACCEYVHELQHVLNLCKIEKEIII